MNLDQGLKRVAVIGAAGKMGSGIAALLLQEMARSEAVNNGRVGSGEYRLILIDANETGLFSLKRYLRVQMVKFAEKNINALREYYKDNPSLVSNEEIIRTFVEGSLDSVILSSEVNEATHATLVFEAIIEDIDAKVALFSTLKNHATGEQYYFTNTSSIPIALLNERADLQNRIIGFHFYNPPIVQKLIETVFYPNTEKDLITMARELARRMHKIVVVSRDIAGFIGNGHFIREAVFACQQARELAKQQFWPLEQAIAVINRITQEYLIRPMGIFQLMDFVGIDVCKNIATIMSRFLPDPALHDPWLDEMVENKVIGGHNPDGSQKNGCFQYEKHVIKGVYSLSQRQYHPIEPMAIEKLIGKVPDELSWKRLQNDTEKAEKIKKHFSNLMKADSLGTNLTKLFLERSKAIEDDLLGKVTDKKEDIEKVLQNGFFHLYVA